MYNCPHKYISTYGNIAHHGQQVGTYIQANTVVVLVTYPLFYFLATALGTLPPPQLLTSVSLSAGDQASTPITTSVPPAPTPSTVVPQPPQPPLTSGLVLSPAAEPFPRKLVDKVQSGQFVEMRELLADNISLVQQLESIQGFSRLHLVGANRPRLREITSLSTWIYCFLGYMVRPHHKRSVGICTPHRPRGPAPRRGRLARLR